jgi:hypothetical protein
VFSLRLSSAADTATGIVPEPGGGTQGALDPYAVLVPYSNLQALTSKPFGFTDPFKVADVCATDDAAPVTTDGSGGNVLND